MTEPLKPGWTKEELADTVIPLTRWRGKTFSEVTLKFLRWCRRNKVFKSLELRGRLRAWLELPEHKLRKARRKPSFYARRERLMRCL